VRKKENGRGGTAGRPRVCRKRASGVTRGVLSGEGPLWGGGGEVAVRKLAKRLFTENNRGRNSKRSHKMKWGKEKWYGDTGFDDTKRGLIEKGGGFWPDFEGGERKERKRCGFPRYWAASRRIDKRSFRSVFSKGYVNGRGTEKVQHLQREACPAPEAGKRKGLAAEQLVSEKRPNERREDVAAFAHPASGSKAKKKKGSLAENYQQEKKKVI